MTSLEIWSTQGYPPRSGHSLDLYVDGQDAFRAISESIQAATSYLYITFAYVDLGFRLIPAENAPTISELLSAKAQAGVDVRVLLWNPVLVRPVGTVPDPGTNLFQGWNAGPGSVQARWDSANTIGPLYSAPFGCHHQKTFVVDGKTAFVGGMNSIQTYWDTQAHAVREEGRVPFSETRPLSDHAYTQYPPLHDLFARFEGPCVQDVEVNFAQRWDGASEPHRSQTSDSVKHSASEASEGILTLQVTRTIAPKKYPGLPNGEFGILESYLKAIDSAQKLIYFENQYYYNTAIDEALERAVVRGVQVIGLLARRPDPDHLQGIWESAREWASHLGLMAHRLVSGCGVDLYYPAIANPGPVSTDHFLFEDIYVHAKVLIVDDTFLTLGSANISSFSMDFHSEMNVVCNDPSTAVTLRRRLWREHLQADLSDELWSNSIQSAEYWRSDAATNIQAMRQSRKPRSRISRGISTSEYDGSFAIVRQ